MQELVTHMTQKDPSLRHSADRYLTEQRGRAFPEYFYSFLGLYCQRFAQVPIIHSDDRVVRYVTLPRVMLSIFKAPLFQCKHLSFDDCLEYSNNRVFRWVFCF